MFVYVFVYMLVYVCVFVGDCVFVCVFLCLCVVCTCRKERNVMSMPVLEKQKFLRMNFETMKPAEDKRLKYMLILCQNSSANRCVVLFLDL